jgi:hypothetical protein
MENQKHLNIKFVSLKWLNVVNQKMTSRKKIETKNSPKFLGVGHQFLFNG